MPRRPVSGTTSPPWKCSGARSWTPPGSTDRLINGREALVRGTIWYEAYAAPVEPTDGSASVSAPAEADGPRLRPRQRAVRAARRHARPRGDVPLRGLRRSPHVRPARTLRPGAVRRPGGGFRDVLPGRGADRARQRLDGADVQHALPHDDDD